MRLLFAAALFSFYADIIAKEGMKQKFLLVTQYKPEGYDKDAKKEPSPKERPLIKKTVKLLRRVDLADRSLSRNATLGRIVAQRERAHVIITEQLGRGKLADGKQILDRLIVLIQHMELTVGQEAADRAVRARLDERGVQTFVVVVRNEEARILAVVGIFAHFAQTLIAVVGIAQHLRVDAQLLGDLLDILAVDHDVRIIRLLLELGKEILADVVRVEQRIAGGAAVAQHLDRQAGGHIQLHALILADIADAVRIENELAVDARRVAPGVAEHARIGRRGSRLEERTVALLGVHGAEHRPAVAGVADQRLMVDGHVVHGRGDAGHQLAVVIRAAGRKDDLIRADGEVAARRSRLDADRLAVLHDDLVRRGVQNDGHAFFSQVCGKRIDHARAETGTAEQRVAVTTGRVLLGHRALHAQLLRIIIHSLAGLTEQILDKVRKNFVKDYFSLHKENKIQMRLLL